MSERYIILRCDLLGLVVSSEQGECDGVGELEQQQGEYGLEGEGAAVHEVAVEDVFVRATGQARALQDVQQVRQLAYTDRQSGGE